MLLYRPSRDQWELPGGKIEEGESPTETVKREIFEELLCNISLQQDPLGNAVFEEDDYQMNYTWYFGKVLPNQQPQIGEPDKFTDLIFFPIDNLPSNLSANMKNLHSRILDGSVHLI